MVKGNSLKSPFSTIFPAYIQRQLTHQCCQCFDCDDRSKAVHLIQFLFVRMSVNVNVWILFVPGPDDINFF